MEQIRPEYYDRFHCIAGACPISCCRDWEIEVDAQAAAAYRSLPGQLGDKLRSCMKEEDGAIYMTSENGHCPMWREDGLCRIQSELGEGALCRVCTAFPRLTHDYGDFVELGLELSCPAAAELILSRADHTYITQILPDDEEGDYDHEAMTVLKATRETALELLRDSALTPAQALARLLMFGAVAQEALDCGGEVLWDPDAAMATARELADEADVQDIRQFFAGLELLTEQWRDMLSDMKEPEFPEQTRALAAYLVNRRWLQAVSDYDLMCRVKFIIIACILTAGLKGGFVHAACMFSREIENDAANTDALLDAAWENPAFTDAHLLGILLGKDS